MIPLFDLYIQEPELQAKIRQEMEAVMLSANYILGPYTDKFESMFAKYCGVKHAIAVSSGSSALHLALRAADIGPGDEVITTPFTFIATTAAICYVGATPVFVDIEKASYNMDPDLIRQAITPRTKAIIPVHLYGQMANMAPIMEIAKAFNLVVIEDVAQACGAKKQQMAGSFGDFGCFSFYPTKNLGAAGDAGMVVTHHDAYAEKLRLLHNCGKNPSGKFYFEAYNARIADIQAAILCEKLKYLDQWNQRRAELAAYYLQQLKQTSLILPKQMPYNIEHVYALFTVAHPERDKIMTDLAKYAIQTGIYYSEPLHLQPVYAYLNYQVGNFPNAEQAAKEVLTLPLYPSLTKEKIEEITSILIAIMRNLDK